MTHEEKAREIASKYGIATVNDMGRLASEIASALASAEKKGIELRQAICSSGVCRKEYLDAVWNEAIEKAIYEVNQYCFEGGDKKCECVTHEIADSINKLKRG